MGAADVGDHDKRWTVPCQIEDSRGKSEDLLRHASIDGHDPHVRLGTVVPRLLARDIAVGRVRDLAAVV